jgi:hypothetical protein
MIGIALQIGGIFGDLNDKETIGAFVVGFFLEGIAGWLFFGYNSIELGIRHLFGNRFDR